MLIEAEKPSGVMYGQTTLLIETEEGWKFLTKVLSIDFDPNQKHLSIELLETHKEKDNILDFADAKHFLFLFDQWHVYEFIANLKDTFTKTYHKEIPDAQIKVCSLEISDIGKVPFSAFTNATNVVETHYHGVYLPVPLPPDWEII